jgi:ribosomal protein S21
MLSVRKKEGETGSSLLYRFTKKIRQSGVLKETKKRRFYKRSQNRAKRKLAAIYREEKKKEVEKAKKMGII